MFHMAGKNEIVDIMKEHTKISTHAVADVIYHLDNNNFKAIKHICKFFGMELHILNADTYILDDDTYISDDSKNDESPKYNSIW